jgi:hypothetical protein
MATHPGGRNRLDPLRRRRRPPVRRLRRRFVLQPPRPRRCVRPHRRFRLPRPQPEILRSRKLQPEDKPRTRWSRWKRKWRVCWAVRRKSKT